MLQPMTLNSLGPFHRDQLFEITRGEVSIFAAVSSDSFGLFR